MAVPIKVKEVWEFIHQEVVDVHIKWKLHEQMFGRGEKRLNLLFETSANFFGTVQEMLLISIQMTISKLGDKPEFGSFKNVNLRRLAVELVESDPGTNGVVTARFATELNDKIEAFVSGSGDMRERRNKFLAHLDYDVALNRRPEPLLNVTRSEIELVLELLRAVMQNVESYFGEGFTAYKHPTLTWDADLLVDWLKRAMRYSELEQNGIIPCFAWKKSDWADA